MAPVYATLKEGEIADRIKDQTWENLEIRQINDVIGRGVFATALIKKSTLICDYKGDYMTRDEMDEKLENVPDNIQKVYAR